MRYLWIAIFAAGHGLSQTPPPIAFQCTEDDMQSFGMSCGSEEPCPVYLELSGIESLGVKLFLSGNFHTDSTTLYSVLLVTEDAGKTWTEPHERIRAAALENIQFNDLEYGWVGGQSIQSIPRDPFFLLTSDGGKTWRVRPVFGETRVGAVEQFVFESRTQGHLLIDRTQRGDSGGRHELYESKTGGESWTLLQVSEKPIAFKRTRPVNPDWRIQPDPKTQSLRVEKRLNDKWALVSSFPVKVGECKIPERKMAEPPPETEAAPEKMPADPGVFVVPSGKAPPKKKKP